MTHCMEGLLQTWDFKFRQNEVKEFREDRFENSHLSCKLEKLVSTLTVCVYVDELVFWLFMYQDVCLPLASSSVLFTVSSLRFYQ